MDRIMDDMVGIRHSSDMITVFWLNLKASLFLRDAAEKFRH